MGGQVNAGVVARRLLATSAEAGATTTPPVPTAARRSVDGWSVRDQRFRRNSITDVKTVPSIDSSMWGVS